MVTAFVQLYCWFFAGKSGLRLRLARRSEHGQASAEYALVLLGAAAIAVLVGGWATRSGMIGQLFDKVLDQLLARVS